MDKYKINYIFNEEKNINDILIIVLKKELKKHIQTNYKTKKPTSSQTQLALEGNKNC